MSLGLLDSKIFAIINTLMFKFEILSSDRKAKEFKGKELSSLFKDFCNGLKQINTKSVFRLYLDDGRVKELILYPSKVRRLMNNKIAKVVMEKRLRMLLGING